MPNQVEATGLQLRSTVTSQGTLELSLVRIPTPQPGADEVVVRVEASPLNPSDQWLLLAGADLSTAERRTGVELPVTSAKIPPEVARSLASRAGQALPVGNEGAGVVVAAGANVQAWLGKTVSVIGGEMY
jgi:NADPH2:quinone reductase